MDIQDKVGQSVRHLDLHRFAPHRHRRRFFPLKLKIMCVGKCHQSPSSNWQQQVVPLLYFIFKNQAMKVKTIGGRVTWDYLINSLNNHISNKLCTNTQDLQSITLSLTDLLAAEIVWSPAHSTATKGNFFLKITQLMQYQHLRKTCYKNKTSPYGFNPHLWKTKPTGLDQGQVLYLKTAIQGGTWTLPYKARYDEEVLVCPPQQTSYQKFNQ